MSLKLNAARGQRPQVLIPDDTVVKVLMRIKKGKYNNSEKGWEGDYVTLNKETGSAYLHCIGFVVSEEYKRQSVHFFITLDDPDNPDSVEKGSSFLRTIVDSAHGFSLDDESPGAIAVRESYDLCKFDGLEFTSVINAVIDMKTGKDKNALYQALTVDDPRYLGKTVPDKSSKSKK
jgi:hypothetical protein